MVTAKSFSFSEYLWPCCSHLLAFSSFSISVIVSLSKFTFRKSIWSGLRTLSFFKFSIKADSLPSLRFTFLFNSLTSFWFSRSFLLLWARTALVWFRASSTEEEEYVWSRLILLIGDKSSSWFVLVLMGSRTLGGALGVFTAGCLCSWYFENRVGTAVDFNALILVPSTYASSMKWSLQILEYWVGLHWVSLSDSLETALIHFSSLSRWENGKLAQRRLKKHTGVSKNSVLPMCLYF